MCFSLLCFFFFKAEDGIRDSSVTGVQTCALPILARSCFSSRQRRLRALERCMLLKQLRAILLGVLYSACAVSSERLVARRLLLRKHERRLRLLNLSLTRVDLGPLHGNLRVDILNAGLRSSYLCARLCKPDAVVAFIHPAHPASGVHVLVVGDRHFVTYPETFGARAIWRAAMK